MYRSSSIFSFSSEISIPFAFDVYIHYFPAKFSCLRNVVSMFHVIEKEMRWRRENGRPEGFKMMKTCKPIVAVGADEPLDGETMKAAYYRAFPLLPSPPNQTFLIHPMSPDGADGLGGVHTTVSPFPPPNPPYLTI